MTAPAAPWSPPPTPVVVPLTVACKTCGGSGYGEPSLAWPAERCLDCSDGQVPNPEHPDNMPARVPCPDPRHPSPIGGERWHDECDNGTVPNPAAVPSVTTELLALRVVREGEPIPADLEADYVLVKPSGTVLLVPYEGRHRLGGLGGAKGARMWGWPHDITDRFMRECPEYHVAENPCHCQRCNGTLDIFSPPTKPWVALQRRTTYERLRVVAYEDWREWPNGSLVSVFITAEDDEVRLYQDNGNGARIPIDISDRFTDGPPPVGAVVTIAVDEDLDVPEELDDGEVSHA